MDTVRRANKKWRQGAPDFVVDCFHIPKYVDCYTVIVLNGDGSLSCLGTNADMSFSGWDDIAKFNARNFRYRFRNYRISWGDLPEKVRNAVKQDSEVIL